MRVLNGVLTPAQDAEENDIAGKSAEKQRSMCARVPYTRANDDGKVAGARAFS